MSCCGHLSGELTLLARGRLAGPGGDAVPVTASKHTWVQNCVRLDVNLPIPHLPKVSLQTSRVQINSNQVVIFSQV